MCHWEEDRSPEYVRSICEVSCTKRCNAFSLPRSFYRSLGKLAREHRNSLPLKSWLWKMVNSDSTNWYSFVIFPARGVQPAARCPLMDRANYFHGVPSIPCSDPAALSVGSPSSSYRTSKTVISLLFGRHRGNLLLLKPT